MSCLSAHAAERLYIIGEGETLELATGIYENTDATDAAEKPNPGYGSVAYISKGTLNIANGAEIKNNTTKQGGAIFNNQGTLTIGDVLFTGNTATGTGGAIYNAGQMSVGDGAIFTDNKAGKTGGAIYNHTGLGNLNIGDNVTFSGNTVSQHGGAIYNSKDTETIIGQNATFSGNSATSYGGAIMNIGGTLKFGENATFSDNTAQLGAGIANYTGTLETNKIIFTGNSGQWGSAIYNNDIANIGNNSVFSDNTATKGGGAIYSAKELTIGNNVVFSGNSTAAYGGAIMNSKGSISIGEQAVFSNNIAYAGGAITNSSGVLNIADGAMFNGNESDYRGGAIYIKDASADTHINKATFKNNLGYGGAIAIDMDKTVFITKSTFSGNIAVKDKLRYGGAIFVGNGKMEIKDSVFIGNKADSGAALVAATGDNETTGKGVFVSIDNVTFQDNEAGSVGAVGNYANRVKLDTGGMIIKNSRFINNKATDAPNEGNAGALFLGSSSVTELDNVIFDGNSSAADGGAIGMRVSTGKGNIGSLKITNSTFTNNSAATTGGAIDNYLKNVVIENTTFTGNSSIAEGGAIYNHAEPDKYGNVGTLNLVGQVTFEGNTANGELNDIYNPSVIKVAENTTLSLDGGISGDDGTTEFAAGTVLNIKQGVTTIANKVSSEGTTLNVMLERGAKTLDLDHIFTHADNEDNLANFTLNQKNALYTLVQTAESVSLYDIVLNTNSDVAGNLGISQSGAGALLAAVSGGASNNTVFNDISHTLNERGQLGDRAVAREAEKLGVNASTLVQSRETMHSNMMFAAATEELNSVTSKSDHKFGAWVRGLFNHAAQDDTAKAAGFDANTYSVVAGLGTQFGAHIKAGLAYAYSQTNAKGHGRDTDVTGNTLMAYAQYKTDNWYTNAILAYSMSDYDESKSVMDYDADADYDVNTLALQSMTGLRYTLGKYELNPEAGIRYLHIARDGYTDKLGSQIKSQDSDFLTLVAGTKLARDFQLKNEMILRPELRVAATYDAITANNNSDVVLPNGVGYTAHGEDLERVGFETGARVAFAVSTRLEFSAGYEGKFRKNYQEHAALLNAKYTF